jgi:hypothetical protein
MASNSWKTYKTAVEAFIHFCLIYKFCNIWLASVDEIAIFIAFLSYKMGWNGTRVDVCCGT